MAKEIVMYASKGEVRTAVGTFSSIESVKVHTAIFGDDIVITFREEGADDEGKRSRKN